mgnify:CR=1 FL=1
MAVISHLMQHRSLGGAIWARRYLSEVRKWRTIKSNKFQRLMQHIPVKGAIWARRYLSEVRKWRTIKSNKFQRLMQHIPVKGAIWARRYLRKTQKLCFSLSIRKDRLFIRKVVLLQTNFRRNLLCEAKWAVVNKTTAQSGEASESVPLI